MIKVDEDIYLVVLTSTSWLLGALLIYLLFFEGVVGPESYRTNVLLTLVYIGVLVPLFFLVEHAWEFRRVSFVPTACSGPRSKQVAILFGVNCALVIGVLESVFGFVDSILVSHEAGLYMFVLVLLSVSATFMLAAVYDAVVYLAVSERLSPYITAVEGKPDSGYIPSPHDVGEGEQVGYEYLVKRREVKRRESYNPTIIKSYNPTVISSGRKVNEFHLRNPQTRIKVNPERMRFNIDSRERPIGIPKSVGSSHVLTEWLLLSDQTLTVIGKHATDLETGGEVFRRGPLLFSAIYDASKSELRGKYRTKFLRNMFNVGLFAALSVPLTML